MTTNSDGETYVSLLLGGPKWAVKRRLDGRHVEVLSIHDSKEEAEAAERREAE